MQHFMAGDARHMATDARNAFERHYGVASVIRWCMFAAHYAAPPCRSVFFSASAAYARLPSPALRDAGDAILLDAPARHETRSSVTSCC